MTEALIMMLIIFAAFCAGIWCGESYCRTRVTSTNAGSIVINTTNPNKDTIRIELDIPVATMMTKDKLTFNVVNEDVS